MRKLTRRPTTACSGLAAQRGLHRQLSVRLAADAKRYAACSRKLRRYRLAITIEQIAELIKSVGMVAAGIWAVWTFHKLQQVRAREVEINKGLAEAQKALADAQRSLAEIDKSRLEQEEIERRLDIQQPQPAIQLRVSEIQCPTLRPNNYLHIILILKNEGQKNFDISFGPSTISVARIAFNDDGSQSFQDIRRFRPWQLTPKSQTPAAFTGRGFRVGARRTMAFADPLTEPGAYFVQFFATYIAIGFDSQLDPEEQAYAIEQTIYFATFAPTADAA